MLTKKQRDLLVFIHSKMKHSDVAPSFEEMKEALGLKSKSGIHRLITALVERGYIERLPHRARALEIKRLPDDIKSQNTTISNNEGDKTNVSPFKTLIDKPQYNIIPLYGKIAAGTPIEAIASEVDTISMPPDMIGNAGHYALYVEGDSMVEAGIHDGDTVIIERRETASNGEIVVALVDDEEATLKRFRRAGNKIILEPENQTYEPQVLDPSRVKVQGRLTALMRTYKNMN